MKLNSQTIGLLALSLLRLLPLFVLRLLPIGTLVNSENVRSSVKRMFRNTPGEILGELFQNSARAGAKRVTITTREGGFTVSDDGSGVEGVGGFLALLKIAETKYGDPGVAQQHPMGIGLQSLLSHDQVKSVTFASGNLELTVDTEKWFGADESYYRTWFDRLRTRPRRVRGLTITVECEAALAGALKQALKAQDKHGHFSPAQGYSGLLDITLDGEPVETRLPLWATITRVLVDTTFKGCRIIIGFRGEASHCEKSSSVLWYGQIVPVKFQGAFDFHLVVGEGRPVEPRSPSRQGLVEDSSHHELLAFVKDQIFAYLLDPKNRGRIHPSWITACFALDHQRALRESPYYVARILKPIGELESHDDLDTYGEEVLFAFADEKQPLLLDGGVSVVLEDDTVEDDYGLCSFLGMTGEAYSLTHGDATRLKVGHVWWKPGAPVKEFFREPGVWGISYDDAQPGVWQPVTADNVFTFSQTVNWDVQDAEFTATASDMIGFLYEFTWGAWSYDHDEASYNELHDSYESSISAIIRRMIGNCVNTTFSLRDLPPFFSDQNARVEKIEVNYGEQSNAVESITVFNSAGETVRLLLMA